MDKKEIGATILKQLGGQKFIAMTGAKNFGLTSGFGIFFKIGRNCNGVNLVTVELDASDTYSMKFEKMTMSRKTFEVKRKLISSHEMVYCDMLQEIFTSETGMYTSL